VTYMSSVRPRAFYLTPRRVTLRCLPNVPLPSETLFSRAHDEPRLWNRRPAANTRPNTREDEGSEFLSSSQGERASLLVGRECVMARGAELSSDQHWRSVRLGGQAPGSTVVWCSGASPRWGSLRYTVEVRPV